MEVLRSSAEVVAGKKILNHMILGMLEADGMGLGRGYTWKPVTSVFCCRTGVIARTVVMEEPVVVQLIFLEELAGCARAFESDARKGH